jgi:hypothetical protein
MIETKKFRRTTNMKKYVMFITLLFMAGCAGQPNIEIADAKATPSAMVVDAVSIFMLIDNDGKADDALVSARIEEYPDAKVELHDVIGGKMQKVEKIDIPAGKVTELKLGSYHIMGFDVKDPKGELTLVLNFEKSGQVTVKAPVMESSGMAMEGMDMGSPDEPMGGMEEMVVVGCG